VKFHFEILSYIESGAELEGNLMSILVQIVIRVIASLIGVIINVIVLWVIPFILENACRILFVVIFGRLWSLFGGRR
jgi:hypothetical protein